MDMFYLFFPPCYQRSGMGQGEPAGQVVGWSVSSWFVVVVVVAVCCLFYSSYIGT